MNILFTGVGGQGVVLAGKVLMNAAINAGFNAKETKIHGMAQRGGSVDCHVRYSKGDLYSPLIPKGTVNYIVSCEMLELMRRLDYLAADGTVIANLLQIDPVPVQIGAAEYPSDLSDWLKKNMPNYIEIDSAAALEEVGSKRVINIMMLGVLSKYLEFTQEHWEKAIESIVKDSSKELNLNAFRLGQKLG